MNPYDERPEPLGTPTSSMTLPGLPGPSRRRRRAATGIALAAVIAAGTTGFVALNQRGDDGGDPLEAAPRDAAPAAAAGDTADAAGLRWTAAEPGSGLGWSTDIAVGDDGNVYSLSTAPGVHPNEEWTPSPQILYSSPNGSDWTEVGVPGDLWASSLDAANGRLYAIGTGPAAAGEGEPYGFQLAASSDGGATWSNTDLPLDLAGLKDRHGDNVSAGAAQVAVAPDGAVLVATTVQAWADPYELLPADVDQRWGVTQTAAGFDVNGPPADLTAAGADVCPTEWVLQEDAPENATTPYDTLPGDITAVEASRPMPAAAGGWAAVGGPDDLWCVSPDGTEADPVWAGEVAGPVARSFTWEELGVDAELQSLMAGEPHLHLAADGVSFEEVAVELPAEARVSQLTPVATPDGFVLLANLEPLAFDDFKADYVDPTLAVFSSADGRTWTPHAAGDLSGWVRSTGVVGDTVVVVFDTMSGEGTAFASTTQVATSTAGSAWTITSPSELVEPGSGGVYVAEVAVGPIGLVALIGAQGDPIVDRGGVDIASDAGYTLHVTSQSGAAQLLDAGGAVVAETASIHDDGTDDAFRWDPMYTTLTVSDPATGTGLATFTSESIDGAMYPANDEWPVPTWTVVDSADGVNWTATPLSDLLGENPPSASVVVTSEAAVVRGYFPTPDVDAPARQVVAVGTAG